jgi:ankyrin repeat protein
MKRFFFLAIALVSLFATHPAYADSPSPPKTIAMEAPFYRAVTLGQLERVKSYIASLPPLINAKGDNGETALHLAAVFGYRDIADYLIMKGADVNAKDKQGKPPLFYALKRNHPALVDLLRTHGAQE